MAVTTEEFTKVPLGVGSIVGESFSILFRNFLVVMILGFVPTLAGLWISEALLGLGFNAMLDGTGASTATGWIGYGAAVLVQIVIYGIMTALMVQMAYDAKLGRSVTLGRYFGPALRAAVPVAVLSLIAGILTVLAAMALIVPGLWVYAVFSLMAPAVVIERAGFRGLGRSAALTKEYRWPVLGALILIGICTGVLNYVSEFAYGYGTLAMGSLISMVIYSALAAVAVGLSGIAIALIYARLREIKEGVSVDELVSVFE